MAEKFELIDRVSQVLLGNIPDPLKLLNLTKYMSIYKRYEYI